MSKTATQNQTSTSDNIQLEINRHLQPYQDINIPNPLDPNFEEPKRYGDYTKLEEGENRLRILSEGIFGVEYWKETEEIDLRTGKKKKKPIRRPIEQATTIETSDWPYFYAFFVWNYKAQKIQILSSTKRGIVKGLEKLTTSEDWKDVSQYDLIILKTKTNPSDNMSVEYSITPRRPTALEAEISEKWENSCFNRNALLLLFAGQDPFEYQHKLKEQQATNLKV
jgi:hypothetical protein